MEELKFLSSNKVSTPPTYVAQFGLYVDEQSLIRCAGRIKNAHLPNSSKCLVLLPKNHHFANLVIQEVHHRTNHSGINQSLSSLREQFWIIRGREIVKKNVRRCVVCKINEGRPYNRICRALAWMKHRHLRTLHGLDFLHKMQFHLKRRTFVYILAPLQEQSISNLHPTLRCHRS